MGRAIALKPWTFNARGATVLDEEVAGIQMDVEWTLPLRAKRKTSSMHSLNRRSQLVRLGLHGHEVQLIGSTVRGQLHCLDPSSSCPPSPGAAVDTPSGWAAARGAGRLCPAAPRSSLMHCPCLRRGRRQRGSNAAYPGGVPWSGRGCHQHHGAANLRAPAYLYCGGTHAVLPFTRDRLRVVNVALG